MQKIVVNDTNVFIDLLDVELLDFFFSLPWEIHTTDTVMLELTNEGQHDAVKQFIDNERLHVIEFESKQVMEIASMYSKLRDKTNVSFTDCSVWYYAKSRHYPLLTGDRKLRSSASHDGVEVHGILYVFDALVEHGIIKANDAASRLRQLRLSNPRLPKEEVERRIKTWEGE